MARPYLTLALLLVGCPKDPEDTDPVSADSGPPLDACPLEVLVEGDLAVDPSGPTTQIHPSAAWDGEGAWVVWARPEPSGGDFDLYATRLAPEGWPTVEPFALEGGAGLNETYPRVAATSARVVVAWQADDHTGQDNMSLLLRSFAPDGSALDAGPTDVQPMVSGAPQTGNGWMPALAADATGGFALGGAWALDSVSTFQAALVALDEAGAPAPTATVPDLDGTESHYYPTVATGPAGERLLAWESWTSSGGTAIDLVLDGALASFADHDDAGLPFASWERAEGGQPYLAWYTVQGGEYDIALAGGDLTGAPVTTTLGRAGKIDHSPIVAAGERGAVVAWVRVISGLRNELVLQPVRLEGGSWVLGDEMVLDTEGDVAPYLPGLSWVCGDAWLVTWSEGDNPDYVVKARFVRFEGFGGEAR